jgi:hypothetical protein
MKVRPNQTWPVSPSALVGHFRDALLALTPIAEKIHMPWQEPDNYDDWDEIASVLYHSIVVRSIESATGNRTVFPMVGYDKRLASYNQNSFLADKDLGQDHAFVCLETTRLPFDTCLFARLDPKGMVVGHAQANFVDVCFLFIGRTDDAVVVLGDLDVVL